MSCHWAALWVEQTLRLRCYRGLDSASDLPVWTRAGHSAQDNIFEPGSPPQFRRPSPELIAGPCAPTYLVCLSLWTAVASQFIRDRTQGSISTLLSIGWAQSWSEMLCIGCQEGRWSFCGCASVSCVNVSSNWPWVFKNASFWLCSWGEVNEHSLWCSQVYTTWQQSGHVQKIVEEWQNTEKWARTGAGLKLLCGDGALLVLCLYTRIFWLCCPLSWDMHFWLEFACRCMMQLLQGRLLNCASWSSCAYHFWRLGAFLWQPRDLMYR